MMKQISKADRFLERMELPKAANAYQEIIEAFPEAASNGIGNRTELYLTTSLPLSNWYISQKKNKMLFHSAYDGLYLTSLMMGELDVLK